jgi:hypothetical protein
MIFIVFPARFLNFRACNWNTGFLQATNISKLHDVF